MVVHASGALIAIIASWILEDFKLPHSGSSKSGHNRCAHSLR